MNEQELLAAHADPVKLELVRLTLQAGVTIVIADLQRIGGPSDWHREQAHEFSQVLAEKGDILLYGSSKKGETAKIMAQLCECVAIMAFLPGGVKVFGLHFEANAESEVAL